MEDSLENTLSSYVKVSKAIVNNNGELVGFLNNAAPKSSQKEQFTGTFGKVKATMRDLESAPSFAVGGEVDLLLTDRECDLLK